MVEAKGEALGIPDKYAHSYHANDGRVAVLAATVKLCLGQCQRLPKVLSLVSGGGPRIMKVLQGSMSRLVSVTAQTLSYTRRDGHRASWRERSSMTDGAGSFALRKMVRRCSKLPAYELSTCARRRWDSESYVTRYNCLSRGEIPATSRCLKHDAYLVSFPSPSLYIAVPGTCCSLVSTVGGAGLL